MNHTVYIALLAIAATLVVFGIHPPAGPHSSSKTQRLESRHEPADLRKVSQDSPYMRSER